jgi:hypothetical protein
VTRDSLALKLLAIIAAFALAALAAGLFIRNGFADTRWLSPAVVSGAAAVADAPAATTDAAPAGDDAFGDGLGPDATATATAPAAAPQEAAGALQPATADATGLDVVRENAAARFTRGTVAAAMVGALIALGWMLAARARAPGVHGPAAARGMRGAWYGALVVYLISAGLIGWRALADPAVTNIVSTGGQWTVSLVVLALLLVAFVVSTVFATPRVLRPSVPAGNLLP